MIGILTLGKFTYGQRITGGDFFETVDVVIKEEIDTKIEEKVKKKTPFGKFMEK